MERDATIFVTGGMGMVGGGLLAKLRALGYSRVIAPDRKTLDLRRMDDVVAFMREHQPRYVFHLAAKVGGIQANMRDPAGFLVENALSTMAVFNACRETRPEKILFLGSSCIYPCACPQPMKEEYLLTGPLEPTNEGYALAKIMGLKLASYMEKQDGLSFVCPMPCNLYGTGDHFDLDKAHVLSSLVKRFVDAKRSGAPSVTLWGDGSARREFLHVDDMVDALIFFMERVTGSEIINVGPGSDVTIRELADMVKKHSGFDGSIEWDTSKPNGMPRKCLDVSRLNALGFTARIPLDEGIARTVDEYLRLSA
jgi:GDP-L-fucose synthase